MKYINLLISKTGLITCLFFISLSGFATDIIIKKDDPVPPPDRVPLTMIQELPVTASIDEVNLAIYFEESVGDAIITVYDADNNVVYQETVDTDSSLEAEISSSGWSSGSYYVTISYGTTKLIGDFEME